MEKKVDFCGAKLDVMPEQSEYSCNGCILMFLSKKNEISCLAHSDEVQFKSCKHDHVIFTATGNDYVIASNEVEKRRILVLRDTNKEIVYG